MTAYTDAVVQTLLAQMLVGEAPWMKSWAAGTRFLPYNPVSGRGFRGINAIWLSAVAHERGYGDTRWLTLEQVSELGGQVHEGEKGTAVQFWMTHFEEPQLFHAVVVNAEQVSGLSAAPERPVLPEAERPALLGSIIRNAHVGLVHVWQRQATYLPSDDAIAMPARLAEGAAYDAALIRQLAKATGHSSRLNRDQSHPIGSTEYARELLRVEIATMMLGERTGMGHIPNHDTHYAIKCHNLIERDPREMFRVAADANAITKFLSGLEPRLQEQDMQQGNANDSQARRGVGTEARARSFPAMKPLPQRSTSASEQQAILAVPYEERQAAWDLGARWDKVAKSWFVPFGVDPAPLQARWAPRNPIDEFLDVAAAMGLHFKEAPIADGLMHRVPVDGDKTGAKSGAYALHLDGIPWAFIQNHKTGEVKRWKSAQPQALSGADRVALLEASAAKRTERERSAQQIHEQTIRLVGRHIEGSPFATADQPYLARKQLASDHGAYLDIVGSLPLTGGAEDTQQWSARGNLLIPICDIDGNLLSAQSIGENGWKAFPRGARWKGGMHIMGELGNETIVIAEGFATGASLREESGLPVVVAFHAGNLLHVAEAIRNAYPAARLIIAGDNDHHKPLEFDEHGRPKPNTGKNGAEKAAVAVGGFALLPQFERADKGTDWNDLTVDKGKAEFTKQWSAGVARAERHFAAAEVAQARAMPPQAATVDQPVSQHAHQGHGR